MSASERTIPRGHVTVAPTSGYRFKSEGVTCFTLCDGFIFGARLSNGKNTPFNVRALDVAAEVIRKANPQERALLKKLIEEVEG